RNLHPGLGRLLGVCTLFVDGSAVRGEQIVPARAQVEVLPPFAGG
ncbi:MAG: MoaD/ThiS family protein, partial [Cutibacterium sp.]|nr:MoaD/ThiS family protein [Cutibacterium sp.]